MRPPGDYKSEGTIVDWTVIHDDALPTLSEVFESLPPEIGFDIEVKMATPDQEHTPSEEVRPSSCWLSPKVLCPALLRLLSWASSELPASLLFLFAVVACNKCP